MFNFWFKKPESLPLFIDFEHIVFNLEKMKSLADKAESLKVCSHMHYTPLYENKG